MRRAQAWAAILLYGTRTALAAMFCDTAVSYAPEIRRPIRFSFDASSSITLSHSRTLIHLVPCLRV